MKHTLSLPQIKETLGEIDLAGCNTLLNGCERIVNIPLFIRSHISYLEANSGNKSYMPYYNRLLNFITQNQNN